MKLVLPSIEYKQSFLEACREFQKEGVGETTGLYDIHEDGDFDAVVEKLKGQREGKYLPEGYVPHTVYFMVEGEKFIGHVDVRHRLNEHLLTVGGHIGYAIRPSERQKGYGTEILRQALTEARELGLKKVLVTCSDDNIASKRIIEKNGGVFENTSVTDAGVVKRRYWITQE